MTKKDNKNIEEVDKLIKRKKEESEALKKMLEGLNSKNNKTRSK